MSLISIAVQLLSIKTGLGNSQHFTNSVRSFKQILKKKHKVGNGRSNRFVYDNSNQ